MSYKNPATQVIIAVKGYSLVISIRRMPKENIWEEIQKHYQSNTQINLDRMTKLCKIGVLALEDMMWKDNKEFEMTFEVADDEAAFPVMRLRKSYLDALGFNVADLATDELELLADFVSYYLNDDTEIDVLIDDIINNKSWWWGDGTIPPAKLKGE